MLTASKMPFQGHLMDHATLVVNWTSHSYHKTDMPTLFHDDSLLRPKSSPLGMRSQMTSSSSQMRCHPHVQTCSKSSSSSSHNSFSSTGPLPSIPCIQTSLKVTMTKPG